MTLKSSHILQFGLCSCAHLAVAWISNSSHKNWNMIQSSWLHLEENDWLLAYSHISTLVEKTTVDRFQLTPHQPNQAILVSQKDPPNQIKQKLHSILASQKKQNPAGKKKQTTGPWSRPLRPPTWQVFFPVAPWYRNFWCLRSASAFQQPINLISTKHLEVMQSFTVKPCSTRL